MVPSVTFVVVCNENDCLLPILPPFLEHVIVLAAPVILLHVGRQKLSTW